MLFFLKSLSGRQYVALELLILIVLTPLFLIFGPRDSAINITLAILFLGYIAWGATWTKSEIWKNPTHNLRQRTKHAWITISVFTALLIIVFFYLAHHQQISVRNFLSALFLYFIWALIQQTIFQFYFLGRLRVALSFVPAYVIIILNGLAYGLVHYPDKELMALTSLGGIVWSYCYYRDRLLTPIALSHALLGTTYYYLIIGDDLFALVVSRWLSAVQ